MVPHDSNVGISPTGSAPRADATGGSAASLRRFFRPRSVAVVGASRDEMSIGFRLLDAILRSRFWGKVYPVNPSAPEVAGLPTFASVRDLPCAPDLAVVAVPCRAVLSVVEDCAVRGVKNVIVISSGFAEVGAEGKRLQDELRDTVREHGIRLIGPNCLGVLTNFPGGGLNATFVPVSPPHGPLAMSSDSGALGLALLAGAAKLGLGVSSCVSVGNRADVSSNDLLEYWESDDEAGVILLYLESFGNPRRFARIARRVGRRKPIVAVKGGRSGAGRRAAGSHTAALAASDAAVDALFRQTGVIRADTLEEMFDLAAALSHQPLPPGKRVGVLTNAGGPAILCADMCEAQGLTLPELSPATQGRLAQFLPSAASVGNPVDMIASAGPEQFRRAAEVLLASGEVDALIIIHVIPAPTMAGMIKQAIGEAVRSARETGIAVPVLACIMPDGDCRSLPVSEQERIPCYPYPEEPAHVFGKLAAYADWRSQPEGELPRFADMDLASVGAACREALTRRGPGWLTAAETRQVLHAAGLPVLPGGVAATEDEAAALAEQIGYPVAVKMASHRIVHKTEVGGVHLNLSSADEVRRAVHAIRDRRLKEVEPADLEGVLVQPMVSGGTEVMVGVTHDPLFGPLVAFGLGGVHVEILGDVCFRVTPLTDRDAREMVRSIRGYRLLEGYRSHAAADVLALEEVLLRVSRIVEEVPEIREMDLNPVFALTPGEGCRIVDARIRVEGALV